MRPEFGLDQRRQAKFSLKCPTVLARRKYKPFLEEPNFKSRPQRIPHRWEFKEHRFVIENSLKAKEISHYEKETTEKRNY